MAVAVAIGMVAGTTAPRPIIAQSRMSGLDELLFRANEYVVKYQQQFSGLVSEERYTQRILNSNGAEKRVRTLVSDYLLVALTGDSLWRSLRDVREVDGVPVRDREQRLIDLFIKPSRNLERQVGRLLGDSARYNIGEIQRNFNQPVLPLIFLDPINQHRFAFTRESEEQLEHGLAQVVAFVEHVRPTLIQLIPYRRAARIDAYAKGRFWLDSATGRVLKSELVVGDARSRVGATVTSVYEPHETLGMWVPVTMEERYWDPSDERSDVITGRAEYGSYRRFQVYTEVSVK